MSKRIAGISDEAIIAALMVNGTITAASKAVGLSERTVYSRMSDREFRAAYQAAKSDLVRQTVLAVNNKVAEAIEAISSIMNNEEINPAVRLQAAQTILTTAGKYADRLQIDEQRLKQELQEPLFSF